MKFNLLSMFFITIALPYRCFSQDTGQIDSLRRLLNGSVGNSRINLLSALAEEFYDRDNAQALIYANQAFVLAKRYGDSSAIVKNGRLSGQLLRRVNEPDSAIAVLRTIEPIALRNNYRVECKKILNALGIACFVQGNFSDALRYNFKSLKMREEDGDKSEISIALNNIGIVYLDLNEYEKAITFFRRSVDLKKSIGDGFDMDRILINIGHCYNHIDVIIAKKYFNDGLKVCEGNCSDQIKAEAFWGIGVALYNRDSLIQAERFFAQATTFAKSSGDMRYFCLSQTSLSDVYNKLGKHQQARRILKALIPVAKHSRYQLSLLDIYYGFGNLEFSTGNYKQAAHFFHSYINLNDSLRSHTIVKNLLVAQSEFEQRENMMKIDSQKKIIGLNEEIISAQRNVNIIIGVALMLAVGFIVLLFYNIRQRKNVNKLLEIRVTERTYDLEINYESSRKALTEREQIIAKMSRDVKDAMSSLRGVSFLARRENRQALGDDYFSKVDNVINQLLDRLPKEHT